MGKSCWIARLAMQQLFPIQILLVFLRFLKTATKCYIPMLLISNLVVLLIFPARSFSDFHKVPGIEFKGG